MSQVQRRDLANMVANMALFSEGVTAAIELSQAGCVEESRREWLHSQIEATQVFLRYFLKNCKNRNEVERFLTAFAEKAPWFREETRGRLMVFLTAKAVSELTQIDFQQYILVFGVTAQVLEGIKYSEEGY